MSKIIDHCEIKKSPERHGIDTVFALECMMPDTDIADRPELEVKMTLAQNILDKIMELEEVKDEIEIIEAKLIEKAEKYDKLIETVSKCRTLDEFIKLVLFANKEKEIKEGEQ